MTLRRTSAFADSDGVDERIDLESLELSAQGWIEVARRFLR